MTEAGEPFEAQLDNGSTGSYHAYPLPESDPFAEIVRAKWGASSDDHH